MKKQNDPSPMHVPETEPAEESTPFEQAVFAENNIEQNFTNDQAAALNQDPVRELPGTPYVPSASLSYEPQTVLVVEDSLNNVVIQNCIREMARLDRMKMNADLKELGKQNEKNRKLVKEIEIKNRAFILLNQENIKPVLEKVHLELELKKQKIERLQRRLQTSEEEIIHI